MLHLVLRDSFLRQPIRFKETFQQPMRIKQSVVILAITGGKIRTPLDQGGIGLHADAFKKFVHFFRNSFFPVTKCVMVMKMKIYAIVDLPVFFSDFYIHILYF